MWASLRLIASHGLTISSPIIFMIYVYRDLIPVFCSILVWHNFTFVLPCTSTLLTLCCLASQYPLLPHYSLCTFNTIYHVYPWALCSFLFLYSSSLLSFYSHFIFDVLLLYESFFRFGNRSLNYVYSCSDLIAASSVEGCDCSETTVPISVFGSFPLDIEITSWYVCLSVFLETTMFQFLAVLFRYLSMW